MNGAVKMENLIIHNAAENNLKHITISIPLNKFTCVTGPSGCGKSSLVYDTIYAESQRNFMESMAGNLYGQKLMDKPKVDYIENLHPALNVSQTYYNVNPRSTVGTVTDISYYIRTLFALYASQEEGFTQDIGFFSPNNPSSCCSNCKGLGEEYIVDVNRVIPDKTKTLNNGAILTYKGTKSSLEHKILEEVCNYFNIDINTRIEDLTDDQLQQLLYRQEAIDIPLRYKTSKGKYRQKVIHSKGVLVELQERLLDIDTPSTLASVSKYLTRVTCHCCDGKRFNQNVLRYTIIGKNIADVENMSLTDVCKWLYGVITATSNKPYSLQVNQLIEEADKRIKYLLELKLGYLCLSRSMPSLSGGESQRVRIANQLSCSLSGILYILDEPCKGLHYCDIRSIIAASRALVKKGNTLIAIEHNKQYIACSDKVIELGPAGGADGGYVVSESTTRIASTPKLNFKDVVLPTEYLVLKKVNYRNLRGLDLRIPLERISCVTGVSGSGKSSLVDVLSHCCTQKATWNCESADNIVKFSKVLQVDQRPIGKTPRSSVVSYLGIYDAIRDIYANCAKNTMQNLTSSDFSMNVPGGRCECCQGTGKKKIDFNFLPESYIVCPECKGKRFNEKVLSVKYKGYCISDVLNRPVSDIVTLFDSEKIQKILRCMIELGVGYISLGQMSMNLSGGESQRIKLAKCLGAYTSGRSLYILDEPTSGLNDQDIERLICVIQKLTKSKETIVIIEHNIEFIASVADYIVDLGCLAGSERESSIVQGLPQDVMRNRESSWFECLINNS